jgi:hypothetical protein
MANKIFHFSGSQIIDQVTGSALTNSGVEIKRTEKGLAGECPGYLTSASTLNLGVSNFSVGLSFKPKDLASTDIPFDFSGSDGLRVSLQTSQVRYYFDLDKGFGSTILEDGKWYHLIMTVDRSGNLVAYVNNSPDKTTSISTSPVSVNSVVNIGAKIGGSSSFTGNIKKVSIYEGLLDSQERSKLYEDFLHTFPLAETKRNFYYAKPTSLNEDGLVASYNMIPSEGGVLVDTSGNGNNGTINGPVRTLEGMSFDGVDDDVVINSDLGASEIFAVCFMLKPNSVQFNTIMSSGPTFGIPRVLIDLRTDNKIYLYRGGYTGSDATLSVDQWNSICIFNDGTNTTYYINGVFDKTVAQTIGIAAQSKFYLGNGLSGHINAEIRDMLFYNKTLTLQEAKDYHNKYANQVYYRNNLKYEKADGISTDSPGRIKGTGTYVTNTTDLATETSLMPWGKNYRECTSAGTEAFISEQAYGTWEFDIYHNDTSTSYLTFISDKSLGSTLNDGYQILINANESLYIRRTFGSIFILMQTANSYISANTWYRIKITRTTDGEFTVWIKGGAFGDAYTLVDTTGGTGTNPVTDNTYTTSKYSVLDFDAGDRVSYILYRKGVVQ